MKHIIYVLWVLLLTSCSVAAQELQEPERRDTVIVENPVFKVWYSEVKEQPLKLVYTSTDRPKNVDRGSMNFYTHAGPRQNTRNITLS